MSFYVQVCSEGVVISPQSNSLYNELMWFLLEYEDINSLIKKYEASKQPLQFVSIFIKR